ncbi:hypothetical protein B0T22DRAFT_457207 [Podospora appendiculata]|uniref:NUC153 domain-containing protein n=1 Tax=Podospora appendiculata TaxID=314037 RepID=A0AAE1CBE3_9PEZI|nr:hypothetical protein B0T22DRAFT_457207 [Podospora appendiculata]
MSKPRTSKRTAAPSITDSRFANFETDPRYQLPSKRSTKTKIDKRFSRVLTDAEFVATSKVDRYGRKLKTDNKKKALERLYEEDDDDEEKDGDADKKSALGSDAEVDDDDVVQRELEDADTKYDPARGGGFSSSESDTDSEEEEIEEDEGAAETRPGIRLQREEKAVETGEITNRLAIVNIDWDHLKSVDLMALFQSFVPVGGRIEKVSIYPSEFGKERMQREEMEGPPREVFKKSKDDEFSDESDPDSEDDEDDESEGSDDGEDSDEEIKRELLQEGNDADFDSDALRTYQLDRLRYYYAVAVCSDKSTAHKIYEATDGSEYMSSSNFLDLRFIPDDVTFDDEPRDECDSVPNGYKPVDFVTDALQHSKVKLTWDMHPDEVSRKTNIMQAFTGSRADIAENDLRAYLASGSESDDEDEDEAMAEASGDEEKADQPQLSKKELARQKMRAALGLGDEPTKKGSKSGPVGDMQITFSSALSGEDPKKKNKTEVEETTIEKYKRKEKERKEQKKAKAVAKREGVDLDVPEPDVEIVHTEEAAAGEEDLGFDDPFFTSEAVVPSKSTIRKEERLKKRAEKEAEDAAKAASKAQLELLMADDNKGGAVLEHFDMKEITRSEKLKGKKKLKGKNAKKAGEDHGGLQEEFKVDVEDPRFKAVFESHEFAIDPSNPKFKPTQGMKILLEEGRKKRKAGDDVPEDKIQHKSTKKAKGNAEEIDGLIASVKRKAGKR